MAGKKTTAAKTPKKTPEEARASLCPTGFHAVKNFQPLVKFGGKKGTPEDIAAIGSVVIQGIVGEIREVKTAKSKSGKMKVANIGDKALALSASLENVIPDLKGKEVAVVYRGWEINPNNGREFRAFDVFERDS